MKNKLCILVTLFIFLIFSYIWTVSISIVGCQNINLNNSIMIFVLLFFMVLIIVFRFLYKDKGNLDYLWIRKALYLSLADMIIVFVSFIFALWARYDFNFGTIPLKYISAYLWFSPLVAIATVIILYFYKLYHSIWRFVSVVELYKMLESYLTLIPVYMVIIIFTDVKLPRSLYIIGYLLSFTLQVGLRFSYKFLTSVSNYKKQKNHDYNERVMVIGAGEAGIMIVKELQSSYHLKSKLCCIIDDNPNKKGRTINGVPIVGDRHDIPYYVNYYRITNIILAIPSVSNKEKQEILNICSKLKVKTQIIPGVYQFINDEISVSKLKDVEIGDLLGRPEIKVNNDEVLNVIKGSTVLVTGGGGSIGSELCRQIAKSKPKQLIIFDIYENNVYDIEQELKRDNKELNLVTLIGSVRDEKRLNNIFDEYEIDIVFHAAAHKHVPLMENSPNEAIKNNVIGTYNTAKVSSSHKVKKFVLISTDKAVNPTNIMGASKRICEMIIQMMDRKSKDTSFVAVRFGNVLGSNGSVIPLFKKQIAEGGPVTVTDKNIVRYFMTIPEAVSLILQASFYAEGGEIFVLDMGEPVKIDDMARTLIRLSGYEPDVDIQIVYTGLRPGEKLYEELLIAEEGLQETNNKLIHIGRPISIDDDLLIENLDILDKLSQNNEKDIKRIVANIVSTYKVK